MNLARVVRCLSCLVLAVTARSVGARPPEAVPVDAPPFAARLSAVEPEWQIAFTAEDGRRTVDAADLVVWGAYREVGRPPLLVLADGSLLPADVFEADKEKLRADSGAFGLMEVPLELLAGVVFRLPNDRQAADRLVAAVASAAATADQLMLINGDRVAGRFEAIADDAVRLQAEVGPVEVELERVGALVFDPALLARDRPRGLRAIVGLDDGAHLVARGLRSDGDSLTIDSSGGLAWSTALDRVVCLQPLGGRVTYLSDLEAAEYRHVPYLDVPWPYRIDRNVSGGLLRAGGRLFAKGLGVHSAARLTYRLDEPYRRLDAALAIDDSTAGQGSVRFRVFVDGREQYVSPTIRGGMAPVPASLDLSGATRIDLVVDFAERADVLDRANWLDARLVR